MNKTIVPIFSLVLFSIDVIGIRLTPVSHAGVARRSDRRAVIYR